MKTKTAKKTKRRGNFTPRERDFRVSAGGFLRGTITNLLLQCELVKSEHLTSALSLENWQIFTLHFDVIHRTDQQLISPIN